MDFTYDDEQEALRDAVRGLLATSYSDFEHRRQVVAEDPGFDEKLLTRMAEMGLLGLPFAEDDGGVGAGPVEISIVAQELGRVLAPEPFLTSTVLAGGLVSAAGSGEQRAEILAAVAGGEQVLAFAHAEPGRRWSTSAETVTATPDGDGDGDQGWTLSGVKEPVPHGARADVLVVSAALPDGAGTGLFLVRPDARGLSRAGYPTHDGGRAAKVSFESTPATPLGVAGADRVSTIATILDITRVIAANQMLGAMQFQLRATSDYLTSRKQFGVTLNNFQALTFRAADMYVSLELATSVVTWATMVLMSGDRDEITEAASRAALQASRASRHIGQEAIQLHGGIGMTAEYNIGSYTSHLTALDHLLGDGNHHLSLLSARVRQYADVDPLD